MKKSKIVDVPKYYPKEKYAEASKEYLKLINPKKNKIKSVYQVGSIGVPGISDIDYFIVFENEKRDFYGKYHILNLSNDSRYMFYHNCYFVNEKIMKNVGHWFPFFNLDIVYGKPLGVNKIKNAGIDAILSTQYLISKIPYDLIDYSIKRGKFYQRTMIVSIYSLRHTINLIDRLGYSKKEWIDFCDEFAEFKNNWFKERNRNDKLIKFAARSIDISLDVISTFDKVLTESMGIHVPNKSFNVKVGGKSLFFLNSWDKKDVLKRYIEDASNDIRYFPTSFAYILYLRNKSGSPLGNRMKNIFPSEIKYKIPQNIIKSFLLYENSLNDYDLFCREKFKMTANGYHTFWIPYYNNSILNWIYEKWFKARELVIIIMKKLF